MTSLLPPDYSEWLASLKAQIHHARIKAGLAANRELIGLYWQIGKQIVEQSKAQAWGSKVLDQIARDLKNEFPDMQGLSKRNMQYMRAFAQAWPDETFVQQLAAQLPWSHHCTILDKVKDP